MADDIHEDCAFPVGLVSRRRTSATPGARDVFGVDATTGQYIAAPGETAQSITKKFTGQHERTAEMRAANPSKTVTNGNWTSLYPNEEIGIPDEWPETPLAKSVNPATPANPGLPSPAQNSTMDVGVVANTQILVAAWARRHGTPHG